MTAKASRSDRRPWSSTGSVIEPMMPPVPHADRLRPQPGALVDFDRLTPRLRGSLLGGVQPEVTVRIIVDETSTGPWAVLDAARARLGRPETRELFDRLVADAICADPRESDRAAIASFAAYAASCYGLCGEIHADCGAALVMDANGNAVLLTAIARETLTVEGTPRELTAPDIDRVRTGVAALHEQTRFAASIETFIRELETRRFCAPHERLSVRHFEIRRPSNGKDR